jgi:hypothetical protein
VFNCGVQKSERSRDSSISIATSYALDSQGLIPDRGKIVIFSITYRSALWPTQPPSQWVPVAVSAGVTRQEREANQSPRSSAEVKNVGAILPLPQRDKFTSSLFFLPYKNLNLRLSSTLGQTA